MHVSSISVRSTYDEEDAYLSAVGVMVTHGRVSTSYIQRKLGIGYNKAAKLVERAEAGGIISACNHVGKREVLLKAKSASF
jgi:S-DNA-T family DNA segregation ATPase FtsK/SpoIIIE